MDKIDKIINPECQYIMFLKPKPPSASAPPSPREGRNRAQFHMEMGERATKRPSAEAGSQRAGCSRRPKSDTPHILTRTLLIISVWVKM